MTNLQRKDKEMTKITVTLIGKCDEEHYIIATTYKALKDWGKEEEAEAYKKEVDKVRSWKDVMTVTNKYVEII